MKFAKELEDELVPEWKIKYLNYKGGKKRIKAVSKALQVVSRTPKTPARPQLPAQTSGDSLPFTHYDFANRPTTPTKKNVARSLENGKNYAQAQLDKPDLPRRESLTMFSKSPPLLASGAEDSSDEEDDDNDSTPERTPLQHASNGERSGRVMRYGSIIATPPRQRSPEPFQLPDPALTPVQTKDQNGGKNSHAASPATRPSQNSGGDERTSTQKIDFSPASLMKRRHSHIPFSSIMRKGANTFPKSRLRQMFRATSLDNPKINEVQAEAYKDLDARQADFFNFLDAELDKINEFYKMKEDEASHRLQVLRNQLHEMRDRRMVDIQKIKKGQTVHEEGILDGLIPITGLPNMPLKENSIPDKHHTHKPSFRPAAGFMSRGSHIGKTSRAMVEQSSPTAPIPMTGPDDPKADFVRKKHHDEVPYNFARRRLKLALQEFYRGLELLKSYALLNRTGFRKINKKYDKAVNARPTGQYMAEKVNPSYFVKSNVLEGHLVAVEDLYARYFERGNHKIAVSKLRSKGRQSNQSAVAFRNGLYLAAGACFGIAGLVDGWKRLYDPDPTTSLKTGYLLQIYAGYFLGLLLFLMFCIDCMIWTEARVNYAFVFEYDTRHVLDWRQLAELPCIFLLLNGLIMWFNFQVAYTSQFYIYCPVILIGITTIVVAAPFRILYWRARKWWGFTNFRLLLSGLYPVEFRDFFVGDMYCSQTYAMSQLEVFFCLYVNAWNNPMQCNSNHSRLLGFLTTLPGIWRALQCLRRYYDSRNWFPHLANFAKYCCNISYYMTLSLYRMNESSSHRAAFITMAASNAIYCSFWDVIMDWSLGNWYSKHRLLRDHLAFRNTKIYYVAIVLDVIMRQQWILYAIFTHSLQHSASVSFIVSLLEVLRRGMWSLFRVENEHCNNVGKFRASRDIPLPYELEDTKDDDGKNMPEDPKKAKQRDSGDRDSASLVTGRDDTENAADSSEQGSLRQRRPKMSTLARVGVLLARAHAQDFEKKRRPEVVGQTETDKVSHDSSDEDDDDDDEDDDHVPGHGSDPPSPNEAEQSRENARDLEEVHERNEDAERSASRG